MRKQLDKSKEENESLKQLISTYKTENESLKRHDLGHMNGLNESALEELEKKMNVNLHKIKEKRKELLDQMKQK